MPETVTYYVIFTRAKSWIRRSTEPVEWEPWSTYFMTKNPEIAEAKMHLSKLTNPDNEWHVEFIELPK